MVGGLLCGGVPLAQDEEPPQQPLDTGIVERTITSLAQLDVKVTDKEGNPIRGLTLDDFSLSLDSRAWELVAVDDLCPCSS